MALRDVDGPDEERPASVRELARYVLTVALMVPTVPLLKLMAAATESKTSRPRRQPPMPLCSTTSPKK